MYSAHTHAIARICQQQTCNFFFFFSVVFFFVEWENQLLIQFVRYFSSPCRSSGLNCLMPDSISVNLIKWKSRWNEWDTFESDFFLNRLDFYAFTALPARKVIFRWVVWMEFWEIFVTLIWVWVSENTAQYEFIRIQMNSFAPHWNSESDLFRSLKKIWSIRIKYPA